jgi:hypothetical protein
MSQSLHIFINHVVFGQNSLFSNKIALSLQYQKLELLFEVWLYGMMYTEYTRGELRSRW